MNFESAKNLIMGKIKKGVETLSENDIHETLPKPVAKIAMKTVSFPIQVGQELGKLSRVLDEEILVINKKITQKPLEKKIPDHELKNLKVAFSQLRKLPKEEQVQKLSDIKESIAWLKIELGKVESVIIKDLLAHPPKSKTETFERVEKALQHLPVSFDQWGGILAVCDNFYDRWEQTRHMRKTMSDREIFGAASGTQPVGDFEIITTPVGFYVRAHDLEDYTNLYYRHDTSPLDRDDQKRRMFSANQSGGFKNMGLTAENAHGRFFLGKSRSVYEHEVQHAVYDLMKFEIGDVWDSGMFDEQARALWDKIKSSNEFEDPIEKYVTCKKEAKEILTELYEKRLPYVLNRGKDEILAYMTDGDHDTVTIYGYLTDHFGLYNYFKDQKGFLLDIPYISSYSIEIPEDLEKEIRDKQDEDWDVGYKMERDYQEGQVKEIEDYFKDLADPVGYKVFVKKYHKILWDGINAFQMLKNSGIHTDVVVRVLTHEPLQKWKKVTERILKEGELKNKI